jgi:hypothetical protein
LNEEMNGGVARVEDKRNAYGFSVGKREGIKKTLKI